MTERLVRHLALFIISLNAQAWCFAADPSAANWHPAAGPLSTRWSAEVTPGNVHMEYPRPQMVRQEWLNLNGLWDYAIVAKDDQPVQKQPAQFDGKILVPFPVESALSGVMKSVSPQQLLWYRRSFDLPQSFAGKRVLLHFGAVDWEATVYLNGKQLGSHRGGYDGFSFDVTDALKPAAMNELQVGVWDPTNTGPQPRGKQVLEPKGIWYTPTTGIWQTVWLEPVPQASIADLTITPDVDGGALRVVVGGRGAGPSQTVEAIALDSGKVVAQAGGKLDEEIRLPIPHVKLWSPDSPFLYDLKVSLKQGGQALDSVTSYFGMRKIALGKDEKGVTRMLLNGKFVLQVGPLDQGFWPDGLYTAPTDAALRYDIEMTKKFGFNMARKHVKIEPQRWYYWCDKLGLLVWQDMPSGGAGKGGGRNKETGEAKDGVPVSPDAAGQFEAELKAMVVGRRNHPSIVMWVVFNEGWGQYDTPRLTKWVQQFDPSRLADNASGWNDVPAGDVMDMHSYPGPNAPKPTDGRAAVLGEFGGLGLALPGHTWTEKSWGYRGMSDQRALTQGYVKLLLKVYELKENAGLNAVVYTQTTDVETECNGLMTYDRAVVKPDLETIAKANRGEFPPPPQLVTLVPTAQAEAIPWRYTLEKPGANWFQPGFDAEGWKEGPAGFGTAGTPGSAVRTPWKSSDIWLRRECSLPEGKLHAPMLMMHHDEDAEVYLNGVLAAKVTGFTRDYEEYDIHPEAAAALKSGKNLIAIHCHQTKGGQYIDAGIVDAR